MNNLVEINYVEIDGIGKCKLPIADIPYKKYKAYQEMMKNEELFFDGMIEMLKWVVKEDNTLAFSQEYLDECSMNKVVELVNILQDGMPKAIEDTKKK